MYYELYRRYTTGDSFGSDTRTESFGPIWDDIALATKAYSAIIQHYDFYLKLESGKYEVTRRHSYNAYKEQDMLLRLYAVTREWSIKGIEVTNAEWGATEVINIYQWCYRFAVEIKPGEYRTLPVSDHCGYFESLHTVYLVQTTHEVDYHIVSQSGDIIVSQDVRVIKEFNF